MTKIDNTQIQNEKKMEKIKGQASEIKSVQPVLGVISWTVSNKGFSFFSVSLSWLLCIPGSLKPGNPSFPV